MPDPRHDACDLVDSPGGAVDVGLAQLGRQQVVVAGDVERQVAEAVVIAVEEPAFLVSVDGIVGGVQVERDLGRRLGMGVRENIDEQALDGGTVMTGLVVAGGAALNGTLSGACSSRFSVLLPATGAQSSRPAFSLPASTAMIGSWRR